MIISLFILATKYLSLDPSICSIKPNKRLINKYKGVIVLSQSGLYPI